MLQISKGECQFLYNLICEIQTGGHDIETLRICEELDSGKEILEEILWRDDAPVDSNHPHIGSSVDSLFDELGEDRK